MSYPSYPGPSEQVGSQSGSQPVPPPPPTLPPPPAGYAYDLRVPSPSRALAMGAIGVASLLAVYEVVEAALAFGAEDRINDPDRFGTAFEVMGPYAYASIAYVPILIAAYVVTCLWLHRVRTNAEILQPHVHHARSAGWAWGGWVVPVVNFWFPFQVVRDVSRNVNGFTIGGVLTGWWTFWLVSLVLSRVNDRLAGYQLENGGGSGLAVLETINAATILVALFFWVTIIRRIGARQDARLNPALATS